MYMYIFQGFLWLSVEASTLTFWYIKNLVYTNLIFGVPIYGLHQDTFEL